MWFCGKVVGKVTGQFILKDLPFLRQMLCGVHTEEGFCVVSSSVLRNEGNTGFSLCGSDSKLPVEVPPPEDILFR